MNDPIDLLQIKIEKAKAQLPEDTRNAIDAVDWKAVIFEMREKKGYSFEQLGDLEIETELVLCGLLSPGEYSKELEKRLELPKSEVNDLVKEMNSLVFAKIKENLIKIIEGKKVSIDKPIPEEVPDTKEEIENNTKILSSAGIEIIPTIPTSEPTLPREEPKKPEETPPPPIFAQKLSGDVKTDVVETEHSLKNLTTAPISYPPKADPYRLSPDE